MPDKPRSDKPRILDRRVLCRSRLFTIEEVDLRFASGAEVCFERLATTDRGIVMVAPLLDADTIILVREYAAGTDRYELTLPKGLVDPGEDALEAADRELREEAGFGAGHCEWLTSLTVAPGYNGQETTVVVARDLFPASLPGDEPEPLEVVHGSLANLDELMAREDLTEARTIATLYRVRDWIRRQDYTHQDRTDD